MASIEKYPPEKRDFPADPWSEWKPVWTNRRRPLQKSTGQKTPAQKIPAQNITVQDIQERHSPTEQVAVRLAEEKKLHKSRRRIVDARLWEQMSPIQQDAALEIALAFEMMGRGLGYMRSNWHRIPGCSGVDNISEAHGRLINTYTGWARRCAKAKIHHSTIIDVLCFGFSCRMIDHDRRTKTGATRENLMKGLSLYCELRGWG